MEIIGNSGNGFRDVGRIDSVLWKDDRYSGLIIAVSMYRDRGIPCWKNWEVFRGFPDVYCL